MFVSVFKNHRNSYKKINRHHKLNTAQLKKMALELTDDDTNNDYEPRRDK